MISVVIVTKNRHEALREISLPSLLAQDYTNFEVIIWDASDDDLSALVVYSFVKKFNARSIPLSFFKAPRVGSASQRNDGLKKAKGDLIFFIDDDSEVSTDGLSAVAECFEKNPKCVGASPMLRDIPLGFEAQASRRGWKETFYSLVGYRKKRTVSLSGSAKGMSAPPGEAQWLSGCSMAFRREVFDDMDFNEKLETFAPYAMCEDIEFSYRVFKRFKTPLLVSKRGGVIHRSNRKERIYGTWQKAATFYYNRYLLMKVTSEDHPFLGRLLFFWTFLRLTKKNLKNCGGQSTWKGFRMALREIARDAGRGNHS
ncbi:MAG: hypothetical protein CSA35_02845 [Dethiosulfovibrio peptidovorans]|nr:MAG: hypothetical protein CSA35_02845 [Dethiosulfovibrio peptidovorans]